MAIKENSNEIIQNLYKKIRSRNRIAVILTIFQIMGYCGSMGNSSSNIGESLAGMVGFNLFIIIAIIILISNSRLKNEIRKLENVNDQG